LTPLIPAPHTAPPGSDGIARSPGRRELGALPDAVRASGGVERFFEGPISRSRRRVRSANQIALRREHTPCDSRRRRAPRRDSGPRQQCRAWRWKPDQV